MVMLALQSSCPRCPHPVSTACGKNRTVMLWGRLCDSAIQCLSVAGKREEKSAAYIWDRQTLFPSYI